MANLLFHPFAMVPIHVDRTDSNGSACLDLGLNEEIKVKSLSAIESILL